MSRPAFDWRIFGLVLVISLLMFLVLAVPVMARHKVMLDDRHLYLQMAFYSEKIALTDLNMGAAAIASLSKTPDWQLQMRTNGIGLPGYQAGWFVMNDDTKAFVAVTADTVIHIPSTKGFSLLLSPEKVDDLMRSLTRKKQP